MQFERSTDQARKIIDLASAEAARLGHESVDTVHVLLGIIRECRGSAGGTLSKYQLDAERILQSYESVCGESDVTLADLEARSRLEADWLHHNYIGTEHLLLGVCCLNHSRAARLLDALGAPPIDLCQSVLDILGHGEEWDRWLSDHPDLADTR